MHPYRLATNTTIWTLAFVLQCALVYAVFRRGVARRFPVFVSLLVFYPLRAALLYGLSGHVRSGHGDGLYVGLSSLDVALQLMVTAEIALHLVRGMGGLTRLRALLWLLLPGIAVLCTWLALALVHGRIFTDRLQLFAWFVLLGMFGAVLKGARSANLIRISAGFAAFSLMQFSALAGRTVAFAHRNVGEYIAWSYVPAAGYLAVVVFWLICLREERGRILTAAEIAA
jgi:hypothetical protein